MVKDVINGPIGFVISLGTLSALSFHFIGGVRHVIMDMGYWEELQSGNASANAAIGLWILLTIVLGVLLW